jgi:hypothetical protein
MALQHFHPRGTYTSFSASQLVAPLPSHQRSRRHQWGGSYHYTVGQLTENYLLTRLLIMLPILASVFAIMITTLKWP